MSVNRAEKFRRQWAVPVVAIALLGVTLAGCQNQTAKDLEGAMGNATPAPSPKTSQPAGEVIDVPPELAAIKDIEVSGQVIAVQGERHLGVGTVEQFRSGKPTLLPLDDSCGTLVSSSDHNAWTVACGMTALTVDPKNPENITNTQLEHPATSAVALSDGALATANSEDSKIRIYRPGTDTLTISMDGVATDLAAVTVPDSVDALVRIDHAQTKIQDIHFRDDEQGGILRVGLGVGSVKAGRDGLFLASDTNGNRLMIYTGDDVIRLHQTIPVDESPWAVAWDAHRSLAWVASTSTNTAAGYRISSGVPEEQVKISTVPDAQSMGILDDGTVVLGSASGHGLNIITQPEKNAH